MVPVTKFSYLNEVVDTEVRSVIDGLPFSTEGYERTKNILKTKYGDTSKIVNAYEQNIKTGKIHDFYDKYTVQSTVSRIFAKTEGSKPVCSHVSR